MNYSNPKLQQQKTKAREFIRKGNFEKAGRLCKKLAKQTRNDSEILSMLASVYSELGNFVEAEKSCRKMIALRPDAMEGYFNLAWALLNLGETRQALDCYKKVTAIKPDFAPAWHNQAMLLEKIDQPAEAEASYRQALNLDNNFESARQGLAALLLKVNRIDEALQQFREVLAVNPRNLNALVNSGLILRRKGEFNEAMDAYRKALAIEPDNLKVTYNIGVLLLHQKQYKEAEQQFRRVLAGGAQNVDAQSNLAKALQEQGRLDESEASYRDALRLAPKDIEILSYFIYCLNYNPHYSKLKIYKYHHYWGRLCETSVPKLSPDNNIKHNHRLRIGYLSADFRLHSVAFFVEALLRHHDRGQVEITCYANVEREDEMTEHMRDLADHWVSIVNMDDARATQQIRNDDIDILVDLSGHTQGNRLAIFARRAAPVQLTWLGYPNTTGLKEMDYRLTDAWTDPEELNPDQYYTEQLVRLPHTFACYTPPKDAPQPDNLPGIRSGKITFGSLNNIAKLNDDVIALWAKILQAVTDAQLVLQAPAFADESVRQVFRQRFLVHGIDQQQLAFKKNMPLPEHLALYKDIDIALDPFPWNGHTTTCHALWMGVPVVVMAGDRHASRMALSVLSNLGMEDWIAENKEAYVELAVKWAGRLPELQTLRTELRHRLLQSIVCDGEQFAYSVEQAYRQMWQNGAQVQKIELHNRPGNIDIEQKIP